MRKNDLLVLMLHVAFREIIKKQASISFLISHIRILAVEVQRVCCKHDCEDTNKSHQVKRIYIKI